MLKKLKIIIINYIIALILFYPFSIYKLLIIFFKTKKFVNSQFLLTSRKN